MKRKILFSFLPVTPQVKLRLVALDDDDDRIMNILCTVSVDYYRFKHACALLANINHAHLTHADSHDHQKPIGNALTTLLFKDSRKKSERSGLAFNVCVVKTKSY